MNKMKNFKRRFSLSVPRTETIEENEFTEQINQLNIRHIQGKNTFWPDKQVSEFIFIGSIWKVFQAKIEFWKKMSVSLVESNCNNFMKIYFVIQ